MSSHAPSGASHRVALGSQDSELGSEKRGSATRDSRLATRYFPLVTLTLTCLTLLIRLPYLAEPFDTDEGGYAYLARMLLDGQVPYRDVWDNKPPLVFLIYAAALAISDRPEAIRLAAAVSVSLATLLLIGLGREVFGTRTGLLAGGCFVLATALPRLQGMNANTEIFLLPGWIGAAWVFLIGLRTGARWTWPATGALAGLACLAKPVAGWLLLAVAALFLWLIWQGKLTWPAAFRRTCLILLGLALVVAPFAVYFWMHQALGDAIQAIFLFNRLYLARNFGVALDRYGLGAMLFVPNRSVVLEDPFIWLFGLAGVLSLPILGLNARTGCLLLWTLAGYLGAKTGWLELAHYYLQVVPALALWAACYLTRIVPLLARRHRYASWIVGSTAALLLLWTAATSAPILAAGSPERVHALKFAFPDRGEWNVQAPAIAAYLASRTAPDETIFIWGREPQIYYYARRRAASRYIHDRPVWLQPGVLEEIRADLQTRRPAYVLDTLDPRFFPEVSQPVQAVLPPDYVAAGEIGFSRLYVRGSRGLAFGSRGPVIDSPAW